MLLFEYYILRTDAEWKRKGAGMAICLRNEKTERLAREVAEASGETLTQAVTTALQERLMHLRGRRKAKNKLSAIMEISHRCGNLPTIDPRSPDAILGYDEEGALPHGR